MHLSSPLDAGRHGRRDLGASTAEYAGLIVLAALIAGAVVPLVNDSVYTDGGIRSAGWAARSTTLGAACISPPLEIHEGYVRRNIWPRRTRTGRVVTRSSPRVLWRLVADVLGPQ